MTVAFRHVPVMLAEVTKVLSHRPVPATTLSRFLVDCTVGGGGHSLALLQADPRALLLGLDKDDAAVQASQRCLHEFVGQRRATVVHSSYTLLKAVAGEWLTQHCESQVPGHRRNKPPQGLHGVLVDLGLSSYQLDAAKRGFSFHDELLDMRFDGQDAHAPTAADLVNNLSEGELARLFREFGEEPHAAHVARTLVHARASCRIETATMLAGVVSDAIAAANRAASRNGRRSSGNSSTHAATRCFQALRIAVNREFDAIQKLLRTAPAMLAPGGRFAVITFHSLEDRLVKASFKQLIDSAGPTAAALEAEAASLSRGHRRSDRGGLNTSDGTRTAPAIFAYAEGKSFWRPSAEEIEANPRSRSATLRVLERIQ